jgi:hypothetical protein
MEWRIEGNLFPYCLRQITYSRWKKKSYAETRELKKTALILESYRAFGDFAPILLPAP